MTRTTGGSVRHHATRSLWEARYVGLDGRRHSVYRRLEREAQEALRAALTARDNGLRPPSQRLTVGDWLTEWLDTSVAARNRGTTAASYRAVVERYWRSGIGRIPLGRLEPGDVQRVLERMSQAGLSPATVRGAYAVLRIALGRAVRNGYVVRNVAKLVDPPKMARVEPRPLTSERSGHSDEPWQATDGRLCTSRPSAPALGRESSCGWHGATSTWMPASSPSGARRRLRPPAAPCVCPCQCRPSSDVCRGSRRASSSAPRPVVRWILGTSPENCNGCSRRLACRASGSTTSVMPL